MTTPTKEQIRTILGEIPRKYDYFWASANLIPFIVFIITEWEKIRNSPKQGKIWEDKQYGRERI